MAIKIDCPHCGTRPIGEFSYGEIPQVPDSITDADERDVDRAFMLSNPEGETTEAWMPLAEAWAYQYDIASINRKPKTSSSVNVDEVLFYYLI